MVKTHLNDLFDQLEPEKGSILDEKIQIEDSVKEEFYELVKKFKEINFSKIHSYSISELISSLNLKSYSSKEITNFSMLITKKDIFPLDGRIFGLLFNEIIQRSPDQNHLLNIRQYSNLWHIGDKNTKNIIINGDVNHSLGSNMKSGEIVLNGNSERYTGENLTGGKITINGNLKNYAGDTMGGGTLVVNGNAGSEVGNFMDGGTIIVNGKLNYISSFFKKGNIIYNGIRIAKDNQVDKSYL